MSRTHPLPGAVRLLYWAPRVISLLTVAFVAMFALDAFTERPFLQAVPDFLIHLLPAAAVALVVLLAWRFELAGAGAFLLLAAAYAASVPGRPLWILAISGPLCAVAALFVLSWMSRRRATGDNGGAGGNGS